MSGNFDPNAYLTDRLFRSGPSGMTTAAAATDTTTTAAPAATTDTTTAPTTTTDTTTAAPAATAPAATASAPVDTSPEAMANAANVRAEGSRILVEALAAGQIAPDDRTYLAGLVSQQAGIPQAEAEQRVDAAMTEAQAAATKAKEAADAARKAAATASLFLALSLLVGAFHRLCRRRARRQGTRRHGSGLSSPSPDRHASENQRAAGGRPFCLSSFPATRLLAVRRGELSCMQSEDSGDQATPLLPAHRCFQHRESRLWRRVPRCAYSLCRTVSKARSLASRASDGSGIPSCSSRPVPQAPSPYSSFVSKRVRPIGIDGTLPTQIAVLMRMVFDEAIDVVIPIHDGDARLLAAARDRHPNIRAFVSSSLANVNIASDKIATMEIAANSASSRRPRTSSTAPLASPRQSPNSACRWS